MTDSLWLPEGDHWGLRITHDPILTGSFTGGEWKFCWHTTEGTSLEGARSTLHANGDEPHFLIDVSKSPAPCVQMIALNQFAKALAHPSGTPETNRANVIQCEIVGFAAFSGTWGDARYQRLASLVALVEHRISIARASYHPFDGPRISPGGWAFAEGHVGHCHAPNNNHTDPGKKFRIDYLLSQVDDRERKFG